jgi:hypothetical protein
MENRSCPVYWVAPGGSGPRTKCTKVLGVLTMVAGCQVVANSPPFPSSLSSFEIRSPRRPMWSHTGSPFPHRPSERKLRKSNVQKLVASYAKVYPSIPTGTRSTQVEKEVCARGTTCLWFCMHCVSEHGDGWATGGIWHSPDHGPLASSTRTRSAPAAGPRVLLSRRPDEVGMQVLPFSSHLV